MEIKDVYEFLLWDNCNNNCKFCFQRLNPRLFNQETKKKILDGVLAFIASDKFIKESHILVVGGEIFYNLNDRKILLDFFTAIIKKMLSKDIGLLYINTNLVYEDMSCLYDLLKLIDKNNLFDRLRFTTSYDLEGRFKTKYHEELMLSNLQKIKQDYPNCQIVTNIILTKAVCNAILKHTFNTNQFMRNYQCWINFIPYIISDKKLTAERDIIFKTLKQVDNENEGYLDKYIANLDLAQDKKLYMYKNCQWQFCSCELAECGHAINFKKYSNKGSCFICDLKGLFNG